MCAMVSSIEQSRSVPAAAGLRPAAVAGVALAILAGLVVLNLVAIFLTDGGTGPGQRVGAALLPGPRVESPDSLQLPAPDRDRGAARAPRRTGLQRGEPLAASLGRAGGHLPGPRLRRGGVVARAAGADHPRGRGTEGRPLFRLDNPGGDRRPRGRACLPALRAGAAARDGAADHRRGRAVRHGDARSRGPQRRLCVQRRTGERRLPPDHHGRGEPGHARPHHLRLRAPAAPGGGGWTVAVGRRPAGM